MHRAIDGACVWRRKRKLKKKKHFANVVQKKGTMFALLFPIYPLGYFFQDTRDEGPGRGLNLALNCSHVHLQNAYSDLKFNQLAAKAWKTATNKTEVFYT